MSRYSCYCGTCPTCRHRAYVARNHDKVQSQKAANQRKHRDERRGVMFNVEEAERLPMNAWLHLNEDQVQHVVDQYLQEVQQ